MADEIDMTQSRVENETALLVGDVCRCAAAIPKGEPGECWYCGEYFERVVTVVDPKTEDSVCACGRCRDKRGIP